MTLPALDVIDAADTNIYRVGRAPDPWAWIDPQYAGKARWDDPDVVFRTIYAADSLFGAFVELLAYARPDRRPDGADLLSDIAEDLEDATDFPVPAAGSIPRHWVEGRMTGTARLSGSYVNVRAAVTVAALRPTHLELALTLGFDDFDAAALKRAYPRELTQTVTVHLYRETDAQLDPAYDGVHFGSRHGDDLALWAVFERPGDSPYSRHLQGTRAQLVDPTDNALVRAMDLHRLTWR